ncbi:MAG: TraR/DksA C4-type zinc finger protein [Candidatus Omnitrophica bacterium]|nr:TraR/DksA C4-type zinc finger protein [Candidatus Omnitrophota bacterium]
MKPKKMLKKEMMKYKNLLLIEKRKMLEEFFHLKKDVLNTNESQKEASGDLSGYSYHLADMASDQYERDFMLRLASDEREKVYAIDEALRRIEDKSYGNCLKCSKAIIKKRLKAVPQTPYCLKCAREIEAETRK